jgi:hypothetical protein
MVKGERPAIAAGQVCTARSSPRLVISAVCCCCRGTPAVADTPHLKQPPAWSRTAEMHVDNGVMQLAMMLQNYIPSPHLRCSRSLALSLSLHGLVVLSTWQAVAACLRLLLPSAHQRRVSDGFSTCRTISGLSTDLPFPANAFSFRGTTPGQQATVGIKGYVLMQIHACHQPNTGYSIGRAHSVPKNYAPRQAS